MKNFRLKDHLLGYGLLICLAWISNLAMAQDWPSKPIKLILPAPAGTGPDVDIRKIGKHLSAILGQPIVIENRPGAATRIGVEAAIRSAPDGYTFLVGTPSLTTMQALYPKLNFDPKKDLIPVSLTAITNYTLSVNAQITWRRPGSATWSVWMPITSTTAPRVLSPIWPQAKFQRSLRPCCPWWARSKPVGYAHWPFRAKPVTPSCPMCPPLLRPAFLNSSPWCGMASWPRRAHLAPS